MTIQILIDDETYQRLSRLASVQSTQTVDEISKALKTYIEIQESKLLKFKTEGKQYLCEG